MTLLFPSDTIPERPLYIGALGEAVRLTANTYLDLYSIPVPSLLVCADPRATSGLSTLLAPQSVLSRNARGFFSYLNFNTVYFFIWIALVILVI